MKKQIYVVVFALVFSLLVAGAAMAQNQTKTQLAFVIDGSGSIFYTDFEIMKEGIASAIEGGSCGVPLDGRLELTVVQFSSSAQIDVPPTVLTQANVHSIATQIRSIAQSSGITNYEAGIDTAISAVTGSPNFSGFDRQVINFSSDGLPNSGNLDMTTLRRRAANNGFDEIDVVGIGFFSPAAYSGPDAAAAVMGTPLDVLKELAHPRPISVHPPAAWPPNGPGWVSLVDNYTEFANAVCAQLGVIVGGGPNPTPTPAPSSIPEPITVVLFGSGVAALGAYVQRRRRTESEAETTL